MPSQGERQLLSVYLEAMGTRTDKVKGYRIDSSYTTSTDGFQFTLLDFERDLVDELELQPVELLIDGKSTLVGRIEVTERRDDSSVVCSGRDYLSELVTCSADPTLKLKEEQTLLDALLYACGPIGITGVVGEEDVGLRNIRTGVNIRGGRPDQSFKEAKLADYKVNPGETLWDFCNRLCARHGCTMQPGTQRTQLVLSEPNYLQEPTCTLVRKLKPAPGAHNTITSATCRRDYSSWPTHLMTVGKFGSGGLPKETETAEIGWLASTGQKFEMLLKGADDDTGGNTAASQETVKSLDLHTSTSFDLIHPGRIKPMDPPRAGYRLYRLLYHRDTDSKNMAQLARVAMRLMAERLKDTLRYECTVRGHADPQTGALYSENTIAMVEDEATGVSEKLWVESRTFEQAENGAASTALVLWRPFTFIV